MSNDIANSISGLLEVKNIVLVTEPKAQKGELIKKLVSLACDDLSEIDKNEILERVLKREDGISTTLDTGLSLPHCRADEVKESKAALAVIPAGIKDPVAGNTDIKVMFLFVSPSNPAFFQKHLQILAAVSEKFKESFIQKLLKAKNTQEIKKLINE
ncbi:mannitol/fructose-specific phosphotransferase system IIA component (Ntr-type) [Elusimicrobium posterum]|uniref:PTS sugar transporter subunit IIA n=1 Tax=Elusimicrobium posterum TaxID=3116653 RepID=UPI003C753D99